MASMETQFAMMNISEEHDWTSDTASTSEYPTPSSSLPSSFQSYSTVSASSLPSPSSSSYSSVSDSSLPSMSSVCYSPRIRRMIENQSRFSETELDIKYSRDHWSEVTDSDTDSTTTRLENRAHFEKLKEHPEWGGFFKDVKVELGAMINEGGQAEIYDAIVEFEDGRKSAGYGYHVVKVMKGDCRLELFQRQWPVGMLCNAARDRVKGPLMWIKGGTLVDDRFAFVMVRQWGDLRKLIDMKMRIINNQGPPFADFEFVRKIMLCIAKDMEALHTKYKIVHRDLKASNVLLWSFGEQLPDANPHVKANVVDYECSVGVVGTGFWRAPEILEQLKKRIPSSKLMFTYNSDVYSYGMLCYELLTGRTPFEGHLAQDYEVVLSGTRPALPEVPSEGRLLVQCVEMCWSEMPWERPSFSEIVEILEASASSSSSSSSSMYCSPRIQSMIENRMGAAPAVRMRKWGDLRKLIDMKMRLNNNRGPPFADFEFVRKVMLGIAGDMDALHTKYKIVHRDLKASKVLLCSFGEELPDANPDVKAIVVNYENSVRAVGTGQWRAPEILEHLKKGTPSSQIVFTFASDVYSYGMVCYELLTGRIPFEGHSSRDYDVGLSGYRPPLSEVPWESRLLSQCVEMCWSEMPWERPSFSEIVKILEASVSSSPSSSLVYCSLRVPSMVQNRTRFSSETGSASALEIRKLGDLRQFIKKQLNNNRGRPDLSFEFMRKVMLCIASDMDALHTKCKIVHRDLKASNVLLWSFGEELSDDNPGVEANVVNYECSVGVTGTEIWRAPEILEQLKKRTPSSKIVCTFESDVYSYGMVCYELLTGRAPFEGHSSRDYDVGLSGNRPAFPFRGSRLNRLIGCVEKCWSEMPWERPSFSEIVELLEASGPSMPREIFWGNCDSGIQRMRKWGDLRKLIDMKLRLNNNQGPPFQNLMFVNMVMVCIARDLDTLYTKYKIVHWNLKASNVLLWSVSEQLPDANRYIAKANVVDYEYWVGVVGTRCSSAPNNVELLKKWTGSMKDGVYSYGMMCYELLTGHTTFEGHSSRDYDVLLHGNTLDSQLVPHWIRCLVGCVEMCLREDDRARPTFSEVQDRLFSF